VARFRGRARFQVRASTPGSQFLPRDTFRVVSNSYAMRSWLQAKFARVGLHDAISSKLFFWLRLLHFCYPSCLDTLHATFFFWPLHPWRSIRPSLLCLDTLTLTHTHTHKCKKLRGQPRQYQVLATCCKKQSWALFCRHPAEKALRNFV